MVSGACDITEGPSVVETNPFKHPVGVSTAIHQEFSSQNHVPSTSANESLMDPNTRHLPFTSMNTSINHGGVNLRSNSNGS